MTNDDFDAFQQAMQDVSPLEQTQHKPHRTPKKIKKNNQLIDDKDYYPHSFSIDYDMLDQSNWVDGETTVSFHRNGIASKTIKQLKLGKIRCEAVLDLHHHTGSAALAALDEFIHCAIHEGCRAVRVIHGKGYKSRHDKPVLKNLIVEDLRKNNFVLAYHSACRQNGGTGALNILLKAANKVTS